tara:strand:+ start:470 stop:718 length:249 start_codon:yes stop_codon:yes gene_type:complete
MKRLISLLLVVSIAGAVGFYVSEIEKDIASLRSHATSNSMQIDRVSMSLQMFYDMAPDEINRMVRANKCQCGHDQRKSIAQE